LVAWGILSTSLWRDHLHQALVPPAGWPTPPPGGDPTPGSIPSGGWSNKAERPWPPRYVKDPLEAEQRSVLAERYDQSVGQLRGAMSHAGMPDPAALERANYCAPS
jgi:hypothetical protein